LVAVDSCGRQLELANAGTPEFEGLTSRPYTLAGLWPGKWTVELHCNGKPIETMPVTIHGTETTACEIEVPPCQVEDVRLDLKLEQKNGKALLHVTAVNVGEEPIVVDRKLDLGIYVRVWDNRGDDAPQELAPRQPQSDRLWTARQWKERTVKLHPGQSTTRVIDLFGGYDAYGDSLQYGVIYSRERINKEKLDRAGRQIQFIQADYVITRTTWWGLKHYYLEPEVPVEQLTRTEATRYLDVKTGKMFAHEEMTKIFDELERKKRRELEPE
jgi:hypothetical protein